MWSQWLHALLLIAITNYVGFSVCALTVVTLLAVAMVVTANVGFRVYGYTGFSGKSQSSFQ